MTRKMRRKALAGLSLMALVLGGASMAWACTRNPAIYLSPSFGRAGSQTEVTGKSFLPGDPVEIRWNSTAGPVIGKAIANANYSFSVAVIVPADAPDGVAYIVAKSTSGDRGQASFQVRGPVSRYSDPEPEPERQTSTSGSGSEATSSTGGNTAGSTSGGSGSSTPDGAQQSGDLGFAEQPQRGSQSAPAPATQTASSPDQASQPVSTGQADARRGTVTAGAPATGTVSSPSASGSGTPAQAPGLAPAPSDEQLRSPTPRSATADLWSGFNSGSTGSLTPGLGGPVSSPSGTTPMAVGLGVLSAGIAALGLGFGAAELRRKRVLVGRDA